jgi:hypothetical protein
MKFKIYRCLREDINLPSVWIQTKEIEIASLIRIRKDKNKIFVHARPIDNLDKKRFRKAFGKWIFSEEGLSEVGKGISEDDNAIFINRYYRDKLELKELKTLGNIETLEIMKPCSWICSIWYHINGAINHPDFSIRAAFYIAGGSLLLGIISIIF